MKNYLRYSVYILATVLLNACSRDFDEINTNPNAPVEVQPEFLLRKVIFDYGEQMSYEGFTAGSFLGQYFTGTDFNLFDRGDLYSPQLGGNPWPILYKNLRDNEIMLGMALSNPVHEVYKGPALILKAYMTATLTDLYGDVPYSSALQGKEGITSPKYDAQEDIYLGELGILANLDSGIEAVESYNGVQQLEGDFLLNGNLQYWVRFANSLKIKYLLRVSDRVDVSASLQEIANEGNYIQDNSQNASFDFTDERPNNFRMANLREGDFTSFVMSETMEDILKSLDDSRIETFFRQADSLYADSRYQGLLNGQDVSTNPISVKDYSLPGVIFREQTSLLNANFMTAWETNFLLAEAAEKGLITQPVKAYYDLGVAQAFEYWETELPTDYLNSGKAAFGINGANPLEQIITQKWIANLNNGYEGWVEFRRTGFPALRSVAASLNNDLLPVRLPYPSNEEALNKANYETASGATDANSINFRVWWDVN
ncbi:MAG: SusD/RagB family nutrient-binding outer membrane lipoprotein [Cyclobacteriaceae bacterium]